MDLDATTRSLRGKEKSCRFFDQPMSLTTPASAHYRRALFPDTVPDGGEWGLAPSRCAGRGSAAEWPVAASCLGCQLPQWDNGKRSADVPPTGNWQLRNDSSRRPDPAPAGAKGSRVRGHADHE